MTETRVPALDIDQAKAIAADFIAEEESCRLKAYPDPYSDRMKAKRLPVKERPVDWEKLSGAPWTIGYGHTRGVKEGDTCTMAQAKAWLQDDLDDAVRKLRAKIGPVLDELTPHQAAALFSFVFNLGTGDPKKREWNIWRVLRARQFDQVPLEFPKFVNANGVKSAGLVKRRAHETILWSTDEPGSSDIVLTSGTLRTTETPPTPADPVPAKKSATIWAAMIAAATGALSWLGNLLAGIPDIAHTAINAINPFAEHSDTAKIIANGLGGLAAVAAIYDAWSAAKKKQEGRS